MTEYTQTHQRQILSLKGRKKMQVTVGLIVCCVLMMSPVTVNGQAAPTFDNINSATVLSVNENAPLNEQISTVSASDGDLATDPITFSMVSDGGGPFAIDAGDGISAVITVNAANTLDFETTTSYSVTVRAKNSVGSADVTVTINVNDVNDNDPVITTTDIDVTIPEETTRGTTVAFDFTASDADAGSSLSYSLSGTDATIFNIDPSTGDITLNTQVDVDPSERKVYKPVLTVSDGARSATATVTLTVEDINDNAPVCSPMIVYKSINEETSGTTLYTLTCTDGDSLLNGNNVLTYTLVSGDATKFSLDTAGAIQVDNAIDYEMTTSDTLLVKVEDSASSGSKLSTTATVVVSINPVNDNNPTWATWTPAKPASNTYTVNENIGVGTLIFTMSASDDDVDVGQTITYSISSITDGTNPVTGLFNVDPNTGEVTILGSLDRDGGISQFTFNVQATDGGTGSHIITDTVNLALSDVNDNAPEFSGTPFTMRSIAEDSAKTGSVVTTVSATDGDVTASTFTYSVDGVVSGGTAVADWAFSGTVPGQLEFARNLDLDTMSGISALSVLRLIVKDGGTPELTGTATLTVSLVADNEHTPTIDSEPGATAVPIAENQVIGTSVTSVVGDDNDIGDEGTLAYSIIAGNTGNAFGIDSTGKISTQTILDKESLDSYSLTVKIMDTGTDVKSVTTTVTVTVTDVNDHQPECTVLFKSATVPESAPVNQAITDIPCSDEDSSDTLTYSVKTPMDTVFHFTTPDNELKLKTAVDYDSATQSYDVEVDVSDGTNTQTVMVRVGIGAVNEDTPAFANNPTIPVSENSVSNPVVTYTATDTDFEPHAIVSYAIQTLTNSGLSLFAIDSNSGVINLLSALDYDTLPSADKTYVLTVTAADGGGLVGTGSVTVTVADTNDNAPVCSQSTITKDLDETQTGTAPFSVIAALGCTDVESGTALTYVLSQSPGSHFTVAADKIELTANTLNYETASSHTLTVSVADTGSPPQTSTVTVYVNVVNLNDGGPTFSTVTTKSIDESIGIGQSVVDVPATDPDGTDPVFGDLQYSIIAGDGSNQFIIDTGTGQISTRKSLDFETTPSYQLVIQAKERGGANSATVTQTINLNDINDEVPTCSTNVFSETVAENEAVDFLILDFACTDKDSGTTLAYSITSGSSSLFKMDGSQLKLKATLDFEAAQSHDLIIKVSDGDFSHDIEISGTVTVGSIDEGPPVFVTNPYSVDVNEAAAVSNSIQTVVANDPDSPNDANGQIKYSFTASYALFVIDQTSGQISLAQMLDRETSATHVLIVRAEDATASATTTVSITVLDSNDNTPQFNPTSYSGTITEGTSTGHTILTVTATDLDDSSTNSYGTVAYALTGSSNFAVDPTSGVITNTAVLDVDTGSSSYVLTVTATDSGGLSGALTGTAIVTITVTTVNQHTPSFSPVTTAVTISEDQYSVGDVIASVTANDADTGIDGELILEFVSPQTKFSISQNGRVGEIRLATNLDFDTGDTSFTIEVKATDKGFSPKTGTGTVVITVNDANDNSPLCTSVVNVDKQEQETSIATLVCSDADAGSTLSYSVLSTTPNSVTPIVTTSGVVTVASALDYETDTSYVILIQVQDNGTPSRSTTVTINLNVLDLNDNDPTMTGTFAFTVSEAATASNTVLYTVAASSNDGPTDIITFTLTDSYFDISSTTGEITLKANAPDYETVGASHTMNVCAEDTANPTVRTACQTFTVTITDENDMTPVFNPTVYSDSVAENPNAGVTVTAVTATDGDGSILFNTIVYSIIGGNTGGVWSIDNTGAIATTTALDYETLPVYSLTVQASDNTNTASVVYNIQITPENEHDPAFTPSTETIIVNENTSSGTAIAITAVAADADGGDDGILIYSIDSGPFAVDPLSGALTVAGSLDRETNPTYTLNVRAVDKGVVPRTGTLALTINIADVNDNAPSCNPSFYSASILETVTAGSPVAVLTCTDDDADPANLNNALTYTITSGAPTTSLFIVDASGAIAVNTGATFDRETTPSYQLILDVADQSTSTKLTSTVTVTVVILDVNDNAPTFTTVPSPPVAENEAVGTTVATVTATDQDYGVNGEFEYQITNGNTGSKFYIDPLGGHIILQGSLDYDSVQLYYLEITATDKGSPVLSSVTTSTVTVTDANDSPPVCATSLYVASVAENSANTAVTTVSCPDSDTVGTVAYSITAGNPNNDFVIDATTGDITTSAGASIDYETTQSYTLEITASDGVQSTTTTVKVTVTDVNEASPQFDPAGPYSVTLSEDEPIGHTVRTVSATDADSFDTVKIYIITAGNGDGKFMIDASTGDIKLQGPLDHESVSSYTLTLQVEDSGGSASTTNLVITVGDINDNDPVCTETSVVKDIDEGVTAATIYTPTCSDADTSATPTLEYTIVSGTHASISINSASGVLSLIGALDYETITSHEIEVQISDKASPTPRTSTITVTVNVNPVNDNTPTFTPSATYGPYNIAEDIASGVSVAQVTATDADLGLNHGTVRYSIVAGDLQQKFGINQATGVIKLVKSLDRETTASYSLTVRATDDDPGAVSERSAEATVSFTVTDVNDNTPVFNPTYYSVDVVETSPFGTTVVLKTLTVQDIDDGVNSDMTITIQSGNGEAKFDIVNDVEFVLIAQLDYETTTSYDLVIQVADGGTPQLKSVGRIVVNVLPANEEAPLMTTADATKNISEATPVGTLVFDADATDSDCGIDGQITYSIDSGPTNNEFVIDPSTGQLYVGSELDFDTVPITYAIIIKATDGSGLTAATSTVSLSIILQDVNDHVPQFASTIFTFNVNENVNTGTAVASVVATDNDSGVNGDLTYSKTGGNGAAFFNINSATGQVTTNGVIDHEASQVYYLSLTVHDGGTPSFTSTGLVKIEVNNMNDNDPFITPLEFAVAVSENAVIGTSVHTFSASDDDTAIDGFSLATPDSYFQVASSTGVVTSKATLDRETIANHILYIQVIDKVTSVDPTIRTSTATLTVILEDVNDNDPTITGTYTATVPEDSSVNTAVFSIIATDPDANENSQFTYAITNGNTGNSFGIDSVGNVQVAGPLDRETQASYTLTIVVSDKGAVPRSDQVDAVVNIGDINDNDPVFSPTSYTFSVNENSGIGTPVGTVIASDADVGANGALTFTLDSFTVGTASHFAIDGASGSITVAMAVLDRESTPVYAARVKVTDAGTPLARTAFCDVTININDLDDNAPVFGNTSYSGNVDENSATTTAIVTVAATDSDTGVNGDITYSIDPALLGGADADIYLKVNAVTGVISPKTAIDYETHQLFTFVVVATDGGTPALSGTASVTVTVNDVNDHDPVFNPTFYNTEVAYNGRCQNDITTVTATDADSGNNGLVSYSLQTATFDYLFKMDADSGQLSLRVNAEPDTMYDLDIQAADAGNPIRTAVTAAKVRVDAYDPNSHIVTYRLGISRASFVAQQPTFLANLQTVVRNTYPSALVRLWCIEEYEGTAQLPPAGRRRLLADSPVDVHTYAVADDSSESLANLNTKKTFLTQDEYLALVAANEEGDPGSSIQGAAWDYYRIETVNPYYKASKGWWDTTYGPIITAISCFLGLVLLGLIIYFIVRYCCQRRGPTKQRKKGRITEVEPQKEKAAIPFPMGKWGSQPQKSGTKRQVNTNAWETNKGNVPDDIGRPQPYRKAFPPMLRLDPHPPRAVSSIPDRTPSPNAFSETSAPRTPRSLLIFANDNADNFNVSNREFEGKAYDHVTGKMYEYNTKTNERRWAT